MPLLVEKLEQEATEATEGKRDEENIWTNACATTLGVSHFGLPEGTEPIGLLEELATCDTPGKVALAHTPNNG
jgi:hypothetical protein